MYTINTQVFPSCCNEQDVATEMGFRVIACVSACPVDAISTDNIRKVNKQRCISCMRCVSVCPTNARGIGGLMSFILAQAIKKPCASRKGNELFI